MCHQKLMSDNASGPTRPYVARPIKQQIAEAPHLLATIAQAVEDLSATRHFFSRLFMADG
jgi:hypothetical protein